MASINELLQNQQPIPEKLSDGTAQGVLNQFNANPQEVYSADNVATAIASPTPAPDLSDPFGLRETFLSTPEIQQARGEVQGLTEELLRARQTGRQQQQAIENLPQALNVIRGEQAQARTQAALTETALAENLQAKSSLLDTLISEGRDKFNIAMNERATLQNLILQYPGANIKYSDSIEKAADRIEKFQKEEADRAYKQSLKDQLMAMGSSFKGLSTNELERKLRKKNKAALEEARRMAELQEEKLRLDMQNTRSIIANRGAGKSTQQLEDESRAENRQRISARNLVTSAIGTPGFDAQSPAEIASLKNTLIETYPAISPEEIDAMVRESLPTKDVTTDEEIGSDFSFGAEVRPRGVSIFSTSPFFGGTNRTNI